MSINSNFPLPMASSFARAPQQHKTVSQLKPATNEMITQHNHNPHSNTALIVVVLAHALAFWALLNAPKIEAPVIEPQQPMMVSLLDVPAPEPELVPVVPKPPEPEPVVKKLPKVKPKETKPVLQPVKESTIPVAEPVSAPTPPSPPAPVEVAKAPEVKPAPEPPQVKDVIEEPKIGVSYMINPAPPYPAISRRIGEQGKVLMRVVVNINGEAESVKIENSSGSTRLDDAAMEAVKKWRFVPAKKNKIPFTASVLVPIKFSLDDA